jgi:hypothetical protein
MNPADLKAEGQQASIFDLTDTTWDDFQRILRVMPAEFTSNDCRHLLDVADIAPSKRGALFSAAITAELIVRKMIRDGDREYPARIPSTGTSAHAAYVQVYRRAA